MKQYVKGGEQNHVKSCFVSPAQHSKLLTQIAVERYMLNWASKSLSRRPGTICRQIQHWQFSSELIPPVRAQSRARRTGKHLCLLKNMVCILDRKRCENRTSCTISLSFIENSQLAHQDRQRP